MAEYEQAMRRRGLAAGTIYTRGNMLRRYVAAVPWWATATRQDVEAWLDTFDHGPKTRYGYVSHLEQFYRWAQREGLTDRDPVALIERPRLPRRLPRPARRASVDFAITVAVPPVDVALVLMADAGLRCVEVAGLEWVDVDLGERVLYVRGKGGHDRMVGIPARLEQYLRGAHRDHRRVMGRTVSATRVSQIVNAHLRACGVGCTAHQLRHLYATRLLAATHDITQVQQALGHQSVTSTQIYAQVDPTGAVAASRSLR